MPRLPVGCRNLASLADHCSTLSSRGSSSRGGRESFASSGGAGRPSTKPRTPWKRACTARLRPSYASHSSSTSAHSETHVANLSRCRCASRPLQRCSSEAASCARPRRASSTFCCCSCSRSAWRRSAARTSSRSMAASRTFSSGTGSSERSRLSGALESLSGLRFLAMQSQQSQCPPFSQRKPCSERATAAPHCWHSPPEP
mmetsp:Transcript_74274/g.240218  ORF Transcript_74274/g.240218 Transcript_74274/m.240218 type:complete len:201 (+) Transcript_74274:49-651(+)